MTIDMGRCNKRSNTLNRAKQIEGLATHCVNISIIIHNSCYMISSRARFTIAFLYEKFHMDQSMYTVACNSLFSESS